MSWSRLQAKVAGAPQKRQKKKKTCKVVFTYAHSLKKKKFPVNEFMKASKKEIRSVSNHPDPPSKVNYIITQVILAF